MAYCIKFNVFSLDNLHQLIVDNCDVNKEQISCSLWNLIDLPTQRFQDYVWCDINSSGLCTWFFKKWDGTFWAWGCNERGQFGLNNTINYSSPVQISGTTWNNFYARGTNKIFATKTDNTGWVWGDNSSGSFGTNINTSFTSSSPVQLPGTNWCFFNSGGANQSTGLKSDGTLWTWGGCNGFGSLGQNNLIDRSSPVQVPGTTWSSIDGSIAYIALKTDGTLWGWGSGACGSIGNGTITNYSSPVQVPGITWCSFSIFAYSSSGIKTDCTLWTWGQNNVGQLGHGGIVDRSSPTQIPGTTWCYVNIFNGGTSTLGKKTDNTLWYWGRPPYNTNNLGPSSPVQIPGTSWYKVIGNAASNGTVPRSLGLKFPYSSS